MAMTTYRKMLHRVLQIRSKTALARLLVFVATEFRSASKARSEASESAQPSLTEPSAPPQSLRARLPGFQSAEESRSSDSPK